MTRCVNCNDKPPKWHPDYYHQDNPQFCTQRCAAVWGHLMAQGDDLANEYAKEDVKCRK